jgi:hypothetical protein
VQDPAPVHCRSPSVPSAPHPLGRFEQHARLELGEVEEAHVAVVTQAAARFLQEVGTGLPPDGHQPGLDGIGIGAFRQRKADHVERVLSGLRMVAHCRGQQLAVWHPHRVAGVLPRRADLHQRGGQDVHVDHLAGMGPDLDQVPQLEGARHHAHEGAQQAHHQFLAGQHRGRREGRQRDRHAAQLGHPDAEQEHAHHRRHQVAAGYSPGAVVAAGIGLLAGPEEAVDQLDDEHAAQHDDRAQQHVRPQAFVGGGEFHSVLGRCRRQPAAPLAAIPSRAGRRCCPQSSF